MEGEEKRMEGGRRKDGERVRKKHLNVQPLFTSHFSPTKLNQSAVYVFLHEQMAATI